MDVLEFAIGLICIVAFFAVMQHGVLVREWLVHSITGLGAMLLAIYYILLALNLPGIETNTDVRQMLVRPGLVVFVVGVILILSNEQLKAWIRTYFPSRPSVS